MKKLIVALFIVASVSGTAAAIEFNPFSFPPPIEEGSFLIDAGLGFVWTGWSQGSLSVPPLFLHAEYALPVGFPISVGAGFAFFQWRYSTYVPLESESGWIRNVFDIFARANWHFGLDIDWLDLYTGISLGARIINTTPRGGWDGAAAPNRFLFNWQLGARFFNLPFLPEDLSNHLGFIIQIGFPYVIKAGVSFRF